MKAFYSYLIILLQAYFWLSCDAAQDVATGKDTVKVDSSGEKPILIFDSMRMMDNLPFRPCRYLQAH